MIERIESVNEYIFDNLSKELILKWYRAMHFDVVKQKYKYKIINKEISRHKERKQQ